MEKTMLAFVDIETTGLDRNKHEIIELGCALIEQVRDEKGNYTFTDMGEIEFKIKPERLEDAEPEALRINGYNEADWIFAYSLKDAMTLFAQKAKNAVFVAHNITFDYPFIQAALKKCGMDDDGVFSYRKLDTISIAYGKLHGTGVDKFSLKALCEHYGVKNENAHTAMADIHATIAVYKKMMTGK